MTIPVIRLFVSSTFDDFWVEREALQTLVFPVLEDLCSQESLQFQAIDLRWGVSPADSARHDTIDICINELRRCQRMSPKPNFMVMLGDRFGWQPPLPTIAEARFGDLLARIPGDADRSFLSYCYPDELKDENAVPPTRRLRPLSGAAGMEDERRIRQILSQFYRSADGNVLEKNWFNLSATGLEILVGALDENLSTEAVDNVWYMERSILDMPATSEAGRYRDIRDGTPDADSASLLQRLKQKLEHAVCSSNYYHYIERWVGPDPTLAGECVPAEQQGTRGSDGYQADLLQLLGEDRYRAYKNRWLGDGDAKADPRFLGLNPEITHARIREVCDRTLAALGRVVQQRIAEIRATPSHVRENHAHQAYQDAVADGIFCGEEGGFLSTYLARSNDEPLLLVFGGKGSGKTSSLAAAMSRYTRSKGAHRSITRYLGVTSTSSDVRALLCGILHSLGYENPSIHTPQVIRSQLQGALDQVPTIIVVDGVEQLSERDLRWLVRSFPANLRNGSRIIISTTLDRVDEIEEADPALRWKPWALPMLDDEAATTAIEWGFGRRPMAGRTLQPQQVACILAGFQGAGRLPLYLSVAAALARTWSSDHVAVLPTDLNALIADYVAALEKHGPVLVKAALGLLAVSRAGLAEQELLELLSGDEAVMAECRSNYPKEATKLKRLPDMLWSRLYAELEGFFSEAESGGVRALRFAHGQFTEAVLTHVIGKADELLRRQQISAYLQKKLAALGCQNVSDKYALSYRRIFFELPYQMANAGSFDQLALLLARRDAILRMSDPHQIRPSIGYVVDSLFAELCLYWVRLRDHGYQPREYLSRWVEADDGGPLSAPLAFKVNRLFNAIGERPIES
ncbi:AAA family ATPase [Massilia sp. LXY-6]|uniref:AAA family ATPase n=1 Tax=Massilia sp. LXY-6 TaxID=3379823 RepID=UPI003EE0ECD5